MRSCAPPDCRGRLSPHGRGYPQKARKVNFYNGSQTRDKGGTTEASWLPPDHRVEPSTRCGAALRRTAGGGCPHMAAGIPRRQGKLISTMARKRETRVGVIQLLELG